MIGFLKQEKKVTPKLDRTVFTSFSNVGTDKTGVLVATKSKNCECKGGVLARGLGRQQYFTEAGNKVYSSASECSAAAYIYKDMDTEFEKKLLCLDKDGSLRIFNDNWGDFEKEDVFEENCKMFYFVNGNREIELFIYSDVEAKLFSTMNGKRIFPYGVQAACVYNNRLFMVLHPFKIVYSSVCDGLNVTETLDNGGNVFYFSENGEKIRSMQVLDGYIYLFSAHGIGRLKVAGDPKDFTLEKVPYAGGEIFGDSVATVGNKICFLATDGVYAFDGKVAKRTHKKLPIFPKREGQVCKYCVFEDQYLLRYTDVSGAVKMVVLDGDGESGYFTFVPIGFFNLEGLAMYHDDYQFYIFDKNGELPESEKAFFTTEKIRFSVGKTAIRELSFEGEGNAELTVISGNKRKTYALTFEDGRATVKTRLFGDEFVFDFRLLDQTKIQRMEVLTETLGG